MPVRSFALSALALAAPAASQDAASAGRTIQVSGTGMVRTPPDRATLEYGVRGEGATPDDATRALAVRQKAVVGGLAGLLGRDAEITTGQVTITEARAAQCDETRGYAARPRLSDGTCAVLGYVATLQGTVRTGAPDKAGTAAGLAIRLGASDARLQGFALADPAEAGRRAVAAALRDAQARAASIAAGSGLRLGPVMSVRDPNYGAGDVVVTGTRLAGAPPPPPPPPPVVLDIEPRPIETRAQVVVAYGIVP